MLKKDKLNFVDVIEYDLSEIVFQAKDQKELESKINEITEDESGVNGVKIIKRNNEESLYCDGIFIEIGADPRLELPNQLNLSIDPETNEVSVNKLMETSLKGVFAAGDLTNASGPLKQTVTAAGQGAIAALSAYTYLSS